MKKRFLVLYEVGANNLSGFLPDLPGVIATAANLDAMRSTMRQAAEFHLEGLAADGDIVPEPVTTSVDFAEEDPEHGVLSCIVKWLEIMVPQYHASHEARFGYSDNGDESTRRRPALPDKAKLI